MNIDKVIQFTYYFAILIISVTLNTFACYVVVFKEKNKDFSQMFIFSISVSSLIQAVFEYIPQLSQSFSKSFVKNKAVCHASGFLLCWFVVNNISHMTVISLIRAVAIKFPIFYFNYLKCNTFRIVLLCYCYLFGFIWMVLPLIGWSKYELDLDEKRCSLDWKLTKSDSLSYIVSVLIFCYFVPGAFISFALQLGSRATVKRKSFEHHRRQSQSSLLDSNLFKICLVSGIIFFFLWTPYAVFGSLALLKVKLPKVLVTIAAKVGELSTLSNVVVNCCINKSFKNHMCKIPLFHWCLTFRPIRSKVNFVTELRNCKEQKIT
ncbi:rhodopsin, G0-coupled [Hydra vulgaris]|uniref:Opsin n=1 Tax=Hydra vulgaris TaxID=6087 RepID=A0A857GWU2_HYDVU|nr:rhodopsin, G0-coupled [Hydra vulgaris]QHF16578.1 opsin [Hydra vulgaris]